MLFFLIYVLPTVSIARPPTLVQMYFVFRGFVTQQHGTTERPAGTTQPWKSCVFLLHSEGISGNAIPTRFRVRVRPSMYLTYIPTKIPIIRDSSIASL